MCDKTVYVKMFGDFEVTFRNKKYKMSQYLNKQPLNLFQYLLLNHDKIVFNGDLYDALWSESKNPKSALKFTIHSLRLSLKEIFQEDIQWIISSKGGYRLSEELTFVLDTDQLMDISKKLENKVELTQKDYKLALKVMDIYTGHLFMTNSQFFWIDQLAEWYRTSFANIIGRICKYLIGIGEYELMIKIDYQAILREPFYEGLHYFYIQGLIKTQEYHKALQYYDEINEAFYKELGTGLSSRFKELYEILEEENETELLELSKIKVALDENKEKQDHKGGFYCTFDMFKHIYDLSLKAIQREDKSYYLILFSILSHNGMDKKARVLNKLRNIILSSIRSSDVCARVNDYQFILLVKCCDYDDTYIIIQRISQLFYKAYSSRQYRLSYSIEEAKK
jgi:Response regulator containing CheY-like receiver and SARP domains